MTIDARNFSPDGSHAGTENDPWPGVAIKNAIDSLNDATDTVSVANGVWLFNSVLVVNHSNWTLQGESLNAILKFTNPSTVRLESNFWVNSDFVARTNIHFKALTFDATALSGTESKDDYSQLRISNANNSSMMNCKILGHPNGGRPMSFFEGGHHNVISANEFDGRNVGGDSCIQYQSLGNAPGDNSHFTISNNSYKDSWLVCIGIDNLLIEDNTLTNPQTGGMVGIQVCGKWDSTAHNITVNRNTVNVGGSNSATITGLPNDPGGASVIDGFNITNNTITGTFASINCQSMDGNNYGDNTLAGNEKHNVVISGNTLHSAWGGSGINVRGGAGLVDTVLVENNVLTNDAGKPNGLDKDANTHNVTVRGNTGIPNDDGTEPIPPEPIPPEPEPEPEKNTVTITVNANPAGSVNFVLPQGARRKASAKPQGKPPKPPAQPPTVTIEVAVDPADTSNIVFAGNAT